jgi:pyruvate/2-oxoglutarate/acetoin dehydrogenase E1 component
MDTLRESVIKTGRVVVLQEASQTGGFAAEVMTSLHEDEDIFFSLKTPMVRVCGLDTPYPVQMLEEGYLIDRKRVLQAIQKTLEE